MYGKGIQSHTRIAVWTCESWTPSPALLGLPPCTRNPAPPSPCSAWDLFLFCRWVHACQASDCTYTWCHAVRVSVWFTSLGIIIPGSTHGATNGFIAVFSMAEEDPISFRVHHAFDPFICQWTSRLLPLWAVLLWTNRCACIFSELQFCPDTHPGVGLPDHAATAKSLRSCPTLCNPIDGSLPGSPIPGILLW